MAVALGYVDAKHAILDHIDDEDRINSKTQGQNVPELGQRGGWLINESGLYSLVLSSKLESAKQFKRWSFKSVCRHSTHMDIRKQSLLCSVLATPIWQTAHYFKDYGIIIDRTKNAQTAQIACKAEINMV